MPEKRPQHLDLKIASPCAADWDSMTGNAQVRFCGHCRLSVHNVSAMTAEQALDLVRRSRGRLCVRYVRGPDGALKTSAPTGQLHQIAPRASRLAAGAFTAALSLCANVTAQTTAPTARSISPADEAVRVLPTPPPVVAGGSDASLNGTVFDATGAVIPNAAVSLVNETTGREWTATTDEEGRYGFQALEAGAYKLKIAAAGFGDTELGVAVQPFGQQQQDATLVVGDVMMGMVAVSAEEPIVIAASENDMAALEKLIGEGADVNAVDESVDTTALAFAVSHGNREMARALIKAGADVNLRNKRRQTALMSMSENTTPEVVRELIGAGASVNRRDEDGNTALMMAAMYADTEVLRDLLDAGARVDARNKEGNTALMVAADEGQEENVRALIVAGANINRKNNEGATALSLARENEHTEVADLLVAFGALEEVKEEKETPEP